MGRTTNFDQDAALAQAMFLFWSKGYLSTSPADLASAMGIGKGSVYNTFGSKRELFDKALELYGSIGNEFADEILNKPGTTKDNLREFLRCLVNPDIESEQPRGCLIVTTAIELAGHDAKASAAVARIQGNSVRAIADRLRQGQNDGDINPTIDPDDFAQFIMTTIAGLRVAARTLDGPTLYRIIDTSLAIL